MGVQGPQGPIGGRGPQGPQGPGGPQGPPGYPGDKGVEGQPGQEGNIGAKGIAPPGPEGDPGPTGGKGPRGAKGPEGLRGPAGDAGPTGDTGPQGIGGANGQPGKDAKLFKPSKCGVSEPQTNKRICCGRAQVHWDNFNSIAASTSVNTAECRFQSDDVYYFPSLSGYGYQWQMSSGGITDKTKNGFTYRTTAMYDYFYGPYYHWYGYWFQWTVSWCGVGTTTIETQTAACCSAGRKDDLNWWWAGGIYKYQDTDECTFKGSPQYRMSISADRDTYSINGVNNYYFGYRPWDKMFLTLPQQSIEWPWHTYYKSRENNWRFNYCGFGESFPTGGQLVGTGQIDESQFPCQGTRLIEETKVVSQGGRMCCGISESGGWTDATAQVRDRWARVYDKQGVWRKVDTSSCKFGNSPRVVWLTQLIGMHTFATTGGNSYIESSEKGFTTQVLGYKEDSTTVTAQKAANWQWQVQWCGFGV